MSATSDADTSAIWKRTSSGVSDKVAPYQFNIPGRCRLTFAQFPVKTAAKSGYRSSVKSYSMTG
jgi:hypothetical protein